VLRVGIADFAPTQGESPCSHPDISMADNVIIILEEEIRHAFITETIALTTLFCLFAGAGFAREAEFDGTMRVGGSTTLLPVIADCASQYMEKYGTWDKVDPSLPKKPVLIFVTGGGSGFGVNSSINGTVDIGMCSRDIKESEKKKLGDYKEYLVSKDCLAFAVKKDNPLAKLDSLTAADIVKIYSGEAKTFRDVRPNLPAKPILVMMRDMAAVQRKWCSNLF